MVRIWGHRGCRGANNPPENSLAAFKAAIDQGADGFELDVFLTRDNKLVVFHDDMLERMTDGPNNHITGYYLEQLKSFRLKDAKGKLTEERIPALDDVLALVDRLRVTDPERAKNFTVNIEIKKMPGNKSIARPVARAIRERLNKGWTADNFQVSSFDMQSLVDMQRIIPEVPLGALMESPHAPWDVSEILLGDRLAELQKLKLRPATINLTLRSMTPEAVRMIKAAGAQPVAWTVAETNPELLMENGEGRATARRILDSGLHAMITDYPQEMRALLAKFASRTSAVKR